jgi:alpha-tubulin suppressor-like RCC1 family protein
MSDFPGKLITKTPITTVGPTDGEGGSASGIWTISEAAAKKQQNLWPARTLSRFLYAWGAGTAFRGLNDGVARSSPVQVGTEGTWQKIAVGWSSAAAIKSDGTLWRWGANGDGELGINSTIEMSSPVQVGALTNWANIASSGTSIGKNSFAAVKTDGTLWAMGLGSMVPDNTGVSKSSPVQIGSGTTWSNVFGSHGYGSPMGMFAIKTDGTLWAWGRQNNGSLGNGFTNVGYNASPLSSPVQIGTDTNWLKVCGGYYKGIALKTNGQIWGWGTGGNAGSSTQSGISSNTPTQLGALSTWTDLSVGFDHAHAINSAGELYGWGRNADKYGAGAGKLGDDSATNRTAPVRIGTDTNWSKVFIGGYNVSAIFKRTNNTLWFAGESGIAGNNGSTTVKRSSPVQIGDASDWDVAGMNGTSGAGGGSIIGTRKV